MILKLREASTISNYKPTMNFEFPVYIKQPRFCTIIITLKTLRCLGQKDVAQLPKQRGNA